MSAHFTVSLRPPTPTNFEGKNDQFVKFQNSWIAFGFFGRTLENPAQYKVFLKIPAFIGENLDPIAIRFPGVIWRLSNYGASDLPGQDYCRCYILGSLSEHRLTTPGDWHRWLCSIQWGSTWWLRSMLHHGCRKTNNYVFPGYVKLYITWAGKTTCSSDHTMRPETLPCSTAFSEPVWNTTSTLRSGWPTLWKTSTPPPLKISKNYCPNLLIKACFNMMVLLGRIHRIRFNNWFT